MNDIFYFGCWREPGHFLRNVQGGTLHDQTLPADFPCNFRMLDGGFLPPKLPQTEGRATVVHLNHWTIVTFWDRSVDRRPGCNSSFVIRGLHTFNEAVEQAQAAFPQIWERFTFKVYEDI